jgi:hypothetical protein
MSVVSGCGEWQPICHILGEWLPLPTNDDAILMELPIQKQLISTAKYTLTPLANYIMPPE